jgi:hypothetical protein
VLSVRLESDDILRSRSTAQPDKLERLLHREEIAPFLSMIAAAVEHSPNHPSGGWKCQVEIRTSTTNPVFRFTIHATANNGVHLRFFSNSESGWNYGSLRNDALKRFVENVFHRAP